MTCRACSKTKDNRSPDDVVRELQASVEALRAERAKRRDPLEDLHESTEMMQEIEAQRRPDDE